MCEHFDISIFIQNLGEDLITIFNRSSELGIHPDEIGKLKEINIAKQVEALLPQGVGVGRGFVFDSYGNISNQCDLILYEKNLIPVFIRDNNVEYSYFPCEGVIAVGEIKSTLNINQLEETILKLEKIKTLKRHYNDNHNFRHYLFAGSIIGADSEIFDPENKIFDSIFTFIFCKDNIIAIDTMLHLLITNYREKISLGIDRIYSLNKQIIAKAYLSSNQNQILSYKKCNGYCSIKDENPPFNVLIDELSQFVSCGRTQLFNLRNYNSLNQMHLDKSVQ